MPHTHSIADDDLYFVIDPTTREIDNGSKKVKLIQYDHNSEMFTFELSRFVEGHDMSMCDSIRVNYININKSTREQKTGTYEARDLVVDDSKITFTWLISRNATQYVGPLNFLINFMCIDENNVVTYEWHTDIFKYVSVSTGMNNEESTEEEYPDILGQWKNEILAAIPHVQSDWNENDETSLAFVKNRPFYTGEPIFTEIIPEQTYTLSSSGRVTRYVDSSGAYPYSLEVGKNYIIVYNGTTYELTSNMLESIAYVGDDSPLTTGSEPTVPFLIAAGNGILQILDYTGNTEVTFKIIGDNTEIKKIDTKYIPWNDAVGLCPPPVFINKSVSNLTDEEKQKYYDLFNKGSLLLAMPQSNSTWAIVISMFYSRTVGLDMTLLDSTGTLHTHSSDGWKTSDITKTGITSTINDVLSSKTVWRLLDKTFDSVSSGKTYKAYISWNDSTEKACIIKDSKGPAGYEHVSKSTDILCSEDKEIVLSSSTADSTKKFKITVDDSGVITSTDTSDSSMSYTPYSPPAVTEADAGKFLRVSSTGEWAAESISNAEEASF